MSIIKVYNSSYLSYIKVINFYIYQCRKTEFSSESLYLGGVFRKLKNENHIDYLLFGVNIFQIQRRINKKEFVHIIDSIVGNKFTKLSDEVAFLPYFINCHQKFSRIETLLKDRKIVFVAGGPTSKMYKMNIKDAFHIAVNNTIMRNDLNFDAVFIEEDKGKNLIDYILNYNSNCLKFFGYKNFLNISNTKKYSIQDDIPVHQLKSDNSYVYILKKFFYEYWTDDILLQPISYKQASIFSALQICCFFHPKEIYLVGCDCSGTTNQNEIDADDAGSQLDNQFNLKLHWISFSNFVKRKYPDMRIVSINPVGLKGFFEDQFIR